MARRRCEISGNTNIETCFSASQDHSSLTDWIPCVNVIRNSDGARVRRNKNLLSKTTVAAARATFAWLQAPSCFELLGPNDSGFSTLLTKILMHISIQVAKMGCCRLHGPRLNL
jgi:hypothetical protein